MTEIDFAGRLIVHIGPHKTGTTSIQQCLHENEVTLAAAGICYPRAGRERDGQVLRNHHSLILAMMDASAANATGHWRAMADELHTVEPDVVVLSSEVLARSSTGAEVFQTLRSTFPAARRTWVVYLRRQDNLLVSLYAERIKRGLSCWPETIADLNTPFLMDHHRRVAALRAAVGDDEIVVVSFDATKRALIDRFFARLSLPVPAGMRTQGYHVNASTPWGALQMMRLTNRLPGRARAPVNRWILAAAGPMQRIMGWGHPLNGTRCAAIMQQYAASNAAVEEFLPPEERVLNSV